MTSGDSSIRIRHQLQPGDFGMVVHLHGLIYAREYGLDTSFEPYVARPLADCILDGRGRVWIAEDGHRVVGSIAMVDADARVGQLRWFLLVPEVRGSGLGRRLLDAALTYGRERDFSRVFLWTFSDLEGARRLYERAGFKVTETKTGLIWGAERTEVRMEMALLNPT
jgi:RimJ/RimL family protein N-acetyltransferase